MTVAQNDVFEVVIELQDEAERALVVRHYRVESVTETDEEAFLASLTGHIISTCQISVLPVLPGTASFTCVTAQRITPNPTRIATGFFPSNSGGVAGGSAPAQSCYLMSIYTARNDRRGRGRMYFPFPPDSFHGSGRIFDSQKLNVDNALNTLVSDDLVLPSGNGTLKPGVWSRGNPAAQPPVAAEFNDSVQTILRPVLASQKRRVNHHQSFA